MVIQDICHYQTLLSRSPDIIGEVTANYMGGVSSKTIYPTDEQDYIMQAAAVIKVNLSEKKPVITVQEALAVSQSPKIKEQIVSGFMEKISDFLKNLFKLHGLKSIVKCTESFDNKLEDAAIERKIINKTQINKIEPYDQQHDLKIAFSNVRDENDPNNNLGFSPGSSSED